MIMRYDRTMGKLLQIYDLLDRYTIYTFKRLPLIGPKGAPSLFDVLS